MFEGTSKYYAVKSPERIENVRYATCFKTIYIFKIFAVVVFSTAPPRYPCAYLYLICNYTEFGLP